MLSLLVRALARPWRLFKLLASTTALVTNLKQISEITTAGGNALPFQEGRFIELAKLVAMESHQVQRHLGIDDSNPDWARTAEPSADEPLLTVKHMEPPSSPEVTNARSRKSRKSKYMSASSPTSGANTGPWPSG